MPTFVSRAGLKLEHALATFGMDVTGLTCADLGCNAGGFTDCLLQRGAARVYAVDTGYGVLDWKLRKDPRVVVMERTNAMHVILPEPVAFVCIDVAWTRQRNILPAAHRLLAPTGEIVTLLKPHYESPPAILRNGILPEDKLDEVLASVYPTMEAAGFEVVETVQSPIKGAKGNTEVLCRLRMRPQDATDR
ncbi:MAG TPA: SAM-dependent methyltransferase [Tepidisphaeraceae bacterium]|jgi:23S rRNA (cytidine1920-2'-O)/16S rRNA (cytidine1409-2'-O)-methyltransferase|nr:SAM-dependent methyltransferase [Tepidisphaeraceae bacterium]